MDMTYRILWFEDTPESFETLSRRTTRYIKSKNLLAHIERIRGSADFVINDIDLNFYDMLIVDLQLAEGSKGYDIINTIRSQNYVNDVLFYSSSGIAELEKVMKEQRLEGVFLSDRDSTKFLDRVKLLIDKSVRRTENVVNIRGIVMDETSEFDSKMKEIILAAFALLSESEVKQVKTYIRERLLVKRSEVFSHMCSKYDDSLQWEITDIIEERDFDSSMKSRLVHNVLKQRNNTYIADAVDRCYNVFKGVYSSPQKLCFADSYQKQISQFRNALAHVKSVNAENPVHICQFEGVDYYCDAKFCSDMREKLLCYRAWFDAVYQNLERITKDSYK